MRPGRDAPPRLADYERERVRFKPEAPERYNPVRAIVDSWAQEDPGATAVVSLDGKGTLIGLQTAAQLAADSRRAARAFLGAGIGKGDRVFVMLPRMPEWYAVLLGAMRIGAVAMPGPNLLTPHDIADRLTRARASAAVTDAAGAVKVDEANPNLVARFCVGGDTAGLGTAAHWIDFNAACEAAGDGETPTDPTHRDDPLLLYFTSGTVSLPKMVCTARITRWATSGQPASGTTCGLGTCTGLSRTPAGRRQPGAASSASSMSARP